jgi:hypothetical protein
MLQFDFPLGLRLWPREKRSERRNLQEGYTFSPLEKTTDSYRFSAVVGAVKAAAIFRSLAPCLPQETFLILEFYQEDVEPLPGENPAPAVYYSPYLPTREILTAIDPFLPRLIHDGFVGFGIANNREGIEIFYSEEKVLTCFTGNHIRIMDLMARHGLRHNPALLFPTDFGHDHLSLLCHPRRSLPEPFSSMGDADLDYIHFCQEITDILDMYPVEENISFFLSKKEQDAIEALLAGHAEFAEYAEDDFGSLLLDWHDFVGECEAAFEGDLWEYRQGLILRDMIQYVLEGVAETLKVKITEIIAEADDKFRDILIDRRKRLDPPANITEPEDHFWYRGVVQNQGVYLRRDLIRQGWYKP